MYIPEFHAWIVVAGLHVDTGVTAQIIVVLISILRHESLLILRLPIIITKILVKIILFNVIIIMGNETWNEIKVKVKLKVNSKVKLKVKVKGNTKWNGSKKKVS